jgi:hypothetical protein
MRAEEDEWEEGGLMAFHAQEKECVQRETKTNDNFCHEVIESLKQEVSEIRILIARAEIEKGIDE